MDSVFVTLVPAAIGLAVSPAPLIELILVLFSRRRVVNAVAFIVTLLAMTAIFLGLGALGGRAAGSETTTTSPIVGAVLAVLGLVLLALGVQNWRRRADTSEPAVFAAVSNMGPAAVAFLAFGAVAVNPKNAVLLLASGQTIGQAASPLLVGLAFVVLATLPYTLAVGYALLGGQAASDRLDRMRAWLVAHNRLIMGVICTALGVLLLVKGAGAIV
ncbi:MAG: GAP family protein [Dermatophilaceae bacterium]